MKKSDFSSSKQWQGYGRGQNKESGTGKLSVEGERQRQFNSAHPREGDGGNAKVFANLIK